MRAAESRGTPHVHGCLLGTGCPWPSHGCLWSGPPLTYPLTHSLKLSSFGLTLPFSSAVSAAHNQLLWGARVSRSQVGANPTENGAEPDANTKQGAVTSWLHPRPLHFLASPEPRCSSSISPMSLNTETLQDLRGPPLGPASGMHFCLTAKPKNAGTLTLCALKTRLGEEKRAGELP